MTGPLLIVDDEPANLALLRQILSPEYALVFARSGTEALAAAAKHHPALVLLDIEMPEMDGYELIARLDADAQLRTIPVYAVSSFEDLAERLAPHANVQGCFGKPWDEPLVLSTLAQRLGTAAAPH